MRVVFAGTPAFSLNSLEALVRHPGCDVVGVYTQPDRPAGRGRQLTPSPVKARAEEFNIPVYQPTSLRSMEAIDQLRSVAPELMVVTAYGLMLPREVLDIPRLGCVNVHASLLPRWRGAAPIQRAIEAGDQETGITLMQMAEGLDTGPSLATEVVPISAAETAGSLHDKLATIGGQLLSARLDEIARGALPAIPQDEDKACYATKLNKREAIVDWNERAADLERRVRAFNPWPICETAIAGDRLRIHKASPGILDCSSPPGTVLGAGGGGVDVACGDGTLRLLEVQKVGGKPMPVAAWLNGSQVRPGVVLGNG